MRPKILVNIGWEVMNRRVTGRPTFTMRWLERSGHGCFQILTTSRAETLPSLYFLHLPSDGVATKRRAAAAVPAGAEPVAQAWSLPSRKTVPT